MRKQKLIQKLFSVLLVVCMTVSCGSVAVLADGGPEAAAEEVPVVVSEPMSAPEPEPEPEPDPEPAPALEPAADAGESDTAAAAESEEEIIMPPDEEASDIGEEETAGEAPEEEPAEESGGEDEIALDAESEDGFVVTFLGDEGVEAINIYYTQDYAEPDETGVESTVARNSDTGEIDVSGSGQVNFAVVLAEGYSIATVSADANYKNLKDPADTGAENTYRLTKVTGAVTVTIVTTTEEVEEADPYNFTLTSEGITNSLGEVSASLKIKEAGTYYLTGGDLTDYVYGRVQIQAAGVTLVLKNVRLTYTNGAVINAKYDTTIVVEGDNYLTRVIDSAADPDDDGGKVIKGEYDTGYGESVSITFQGSGTLNIDAPKKGIGVDVYFDETTHAYNTEVTGSIKLNATVTVDGPTLNITSAHECIEANVIRLVSGKGNFYSSGDDAINAGTDADDTDESAGGGGPGGSGGGRAQNALYPYISYNMTDMSIEISGGNWYMNSAGDGIDSNGNVVISGGVTEVYSSTSGDNNAVDYGEENRGVFTISGGTLLAVGMSNMQGVPSSGNYVFFTGLSIQKGSSVTITDAGGNTLYSVTAPKNANSVLFSAPGVRNGDTYTVNVGGTTSTATAGQGGQGGSGEPGGPGGPGGQGGSGEPDGQGGKQFANGWVKSGGSWYYFQNGRIYTGWLVIGGSAYYLDTRTGAMATGWKQIGNAWYYFSSSGAMQNAKWLQLSGKWYYFNANGVMATGWLTLGSTTYYLDDSGAMVTGWKSVNGTWFYFASSGAMQSSKWVQSSGKWYYLGANGAMQTGWLTLGSTTYYLNASGAMATGWASIDGSWYCFASSGAMQSSKWVQSSGKWYYLKEDGTMAAAETVTVGGKEYTFSDAGVWIA